MIMRYEYCDSANEVVDSVVADVVELFGSADDDVVAQLRQVLAQASVRVADLEVEYHRLGDFHPQNVADELAEYIG